MLNKIFTCVGVIIGVIVVVCAMTILVTFTIDTVKIISATW